ncbi:MAG: glycosyltransferase family 39 protein [Anaerolineae bacterium]|nr:glycosyltransferase family 39 protein [Anaerolineae bacterium]
MRVEVLTGWKARRYPATARPAGSRVVPWTTALVMPLAGLLTAFVLRVWSLDRFPLREDEALYGYWARLIASGRDPMLERVAVDKPPFFLYSLAQVFTWFGPTVTVGRLLNVVCSLVAVLALWVLARRVYDRPTADLAGWLFVVSPFAVAFAPTLYTDPMMVAWLLLALAAATTAGRAWGIPGGLLAGLGLGMAFATKQNALLLAPLVVGALLIAAWHRLPSRGRVYRIPLTLAAAGAGFYYVWFKVWQWDGWRILPAEIPDFWQQAWNTYGGLSLLPWEAWPERVRAWVEVWRWLGGSLAGTLALVLLVAVAVWADLRPGPAAPRQGDASSALPRFWDALFLSYGLVYLGVHVVFSFQPWDRYLLPLAPLLALLAARGVMVLRQMRTAWLRRPAPVLLAGLLVIGGLRAADARIPVGGDHGGWSGIEQVAAYLQEVVPAERGVLYHRWEGWHWNWYLWDGPHGRVYWADPAMLVADLAPNPTGYTRFVVFPGWHEDERPALEAALRPYGLRLAPRLIVRRPDVPRPQFTVYQIVPIGAP